MPRACPLEPLELPHRATLGTSKVAPPRCQPEPECHWFSLTTGSEDRHWHVLYRVPFIFFSSRQYLSPSTSGPSLPLQSLSEDFLGSRLHRNGSLEICSLLLFPLGFSLQISHPTTVPLHTPRRFTGAPTPASSIPSQLRICTRDLHPRCSPRTSTPTTTRLIETLPWGECVSQGQSGFKGEAIRRHGRVHPSQYGRLCAVFLADMADR